MRYDDDLHVMDQAVCLAATTHGMIVLSTPPWGDHVEVARWPDEDWNGFLILGRTLGVRLLYAGLHRLSEHHLHAKSKRYRRLEADAAVWDAARVSTRTATRTRGGMAVRRGRALLGCRSHVAPRPRTVPA